MGALENKLDKAYEGKPVEELAKAPVAALQGVSDAMAAKLTEALGVKTIGDLGTNKYFLWAQSIATLAE